MSDSFATPRTIAHQASLSMGFPRQEYWRGLPFPSPGDLSNPGNELGSPELQADSLPSETPGKPTDIYVLKDPLVPFTVLIPVPNVGFGIVDNKHMLIKMSSMFSIKIFVSIYYGFLKINFKI